MQNTPVTVHIQHKSIEKKRKWTVGKIDLNCPDERKEIIKTISMSFKVTGKKKKKVNWMKEKDININCLTIR